MNSALLMIYSSEKLTFFGDENTTWSELVISVFLIENALIAFKFLLAAAIPDNPDWIEKEIKDQKNRVKQVQAEINEKNVEAKVGEDKPIELVEKALHNLHQQPKHGP